MKTKYYRYPSGIQRGKLGCKVGILFFLLILIFKNQPESYRNITDYKVMIIGAPLAIIGCLYFIGTWCDIGVDEEGLKIEFLWFYLRLPWDEITGIKFFGPKAFGYWIVTTKKGLTPFHFIYSFGAMTLQRSFHIHPQSNTHRYVLKLIRDYLNGRWSPKAGINGLQASEQ